jgi:HlyD family secretion protein
MGETTDIKNIQDVRDNGNTGSISNSGNPEQMTNANSAINALDPSESRNGINSASSEIPDHGNQPVAIDSSLTINPTNPDSSNSALVTPNHNSETIATHTITSPEARSELQSEPNQLTTETELENWQPQPRPRNPWLKRIAYTVAGVGIAGLLALALRPTPLAVDVYEVKRDSFQVTVDNEGETRVRSRYTIATPISGRLNRISLDEGDPVAANAVLAQIDPLPIDSQVRSAQARLRELQAEREGVETIRPKSQALDQAEARIEAAIAQQNQIAAQVTQAQANLEQAQRDVNRSRKLAADGVIPQTELEAAELLVTNRAKQLDAVQKELASAKANVKAAQDELAVLAAEQRDPDYMLDVYDARIASVEAELANLADEANRTEIYAPVAGTVLRVLEESARYVEAGTVLIELGNAKELELVIDVLSSDAVKIDPGDRIIIEDWGGDRPLYGMVRYIEPSAFMKVSALGVDEQRVNVIGDLDDIPPQLGDRFRIQASIVIWEDPQALQVPLSSLFRCDQSWCVYKVESGRAIQQQVTVVQRNNFAAAISEGLQVGETTILHPNEKLSDGLRVKPR